MTRFHIAAGLFIALANTVQGQSGSWSDQFDRPGLLGRVFAVDEFAGEIVAGGLAVEADGAELGLAVRWDGQHWSRIGAGIQGFVVEDFDQYQGELVAAGTFDLAGGQSVKSIARWNGAQWQPLGGGIGLSFAVLGDVFALEVYQNELYAAGRFDRADGNVVVANIARWNGAQWSVVGSGFDGEVYALKAGADGQLYAGGAFGLAGGVAAKNIAAWNGSTWSAVGPGLGVAFNSPVRALEWHASKLWAGGYFDVPGGSPYEKLASFDGNAWQGEGSFPDSSIGVSIYSLRSFGPDLYVGGNIVSVDGIQIDRIARRTGAQWTSIGGVRGFPNENLVLALAIHGTDLIVGGNFTHVGRSFAPGVPVVTNSIAGFDGTSWSQIGKGLGFDAAVAGAMLWNGGVVAVGNFTEAGRSKAAQLSFYDGNDWRRLADLNGQGYDLCTFGNELVVAGNFTTVDGQPFPGVAAFDGTSWHGFGDGGFFGYGAQAVAVYQNQLYAGSIGGVKRWNGSAWQTFAPQIFGSVGALYVHNNVLYIAGEFAVTGGHIASWNGTTQQIVGGGMNGSVNALTTFNGDLIAGGIFTQAGGLAVNRIARWNGSNWTAFANIPGLEVTALTVFRGELHAGGSPLFPVPAVGYIGRFDGAQWQRLSVGVNGAVAQLVADDAAGRLYVAGSFQDADNKPSWNFAQWNVPTIGTAFCTGDGSGGACPCGQASTNGHGCPNSVFALGAHLAASGLASISADSLVLAASNMPGPGLMFQGDGQLGSAVAFGDGLLCTGGMIVRMGVVFPTNGSASFPGGLTPSPVHVAGGTTAADVRHYQCWYRDAVSFCTPSTFNITQGVALSWTP